MMRSRLAIHFCFWILIPSCTAVMAQEIDKLPFRLEGEVHLVGIYSAEMKNRRRIVKVRVDRPGNPVSLVLLSHNAVEWEVIPSPKTKLKQIVLGGMELSTVLNPLSGVDIIPATASYSPFHLYVPGITENKALTLTVVSRVLKRVGVTKFASVQVPSELPKGGFDVSKLEITPLSEETRRFPWKDEGSCSAWKARPALVAESTNGVPGRPVVDSRSPLVPYFPSGPDYRKAIDTDQNLRMAIAAGDRLYGLGSNSKVYLFRPMMGGLKYETAEEIHLPPELEESWQISALAYRAKTKSLLLILDELVTGSNVGTSRMVELSVPEHSFGKPILLDVPDTVSAAYDDRTDRLAVLVAPTQPNEPPKMRFLSEDGKTVGEMSLRSGAEGKWTVPSYSTDPAQLFIRDGCLMLVPRAILLGAGAGSPEKRSIVLIDPERRLEQRTWAEFDERKDYLSTVDES